MRASHLILLFAVFSTSPALKAQQGKNLTLEEIWNSPTFRSQQVEGFNSLKDGESYCRKEALEGGGFDLNRYSFATGQKTGNILHSWELTSPAGDEPGFDNFTFSNDETKLLITQNTKHIYRHSTVSGFYIYDFTQHKVISITDKLVMYPTFSPDGTKVAWVYENNLYYSSVSEPKEIAVTTDGMKNSIINGAVDWVYEEEFAMSRGFEWSPDSKKIAFYRFDESAVPEFGMDMYGSLYPKRETWKYPKAGEANSKVSVHVYELAGAKTLRCDASDEYIPRMAWTKDPNLLSIQTLNRHQNDWKLLYASAMDGATSVVLHETNEAYVEITDNLYFLSNGQILWTSESDGFNHIYCWEPFSKKKMLQITSGNWDVDALLGLDEKAGLIYYLSSEVSPLESHLYAVGLNGKGKKRITRLPGNHSITFNKGCRYFLDIRSTMTDPPVFTLFKANGDTLRTLARNDKLNSKLREYKLGKVSFGTLPNGNGDQLNYWMITPPDFDPNASKKYPVLMHVYGGPGHNTVRNQWGGAQYLWHQMMAEQGVVVVSVDNRGTGHRGAAFKKSTYLQLGKLETEDQIAAARWLGRQPGFDSSRIGIWGWSFGGYMSSLCITKGNEVFRGAVAVAPVTTWRYYDNIYTERYLRTPQENAEGYDQNSPINFVDRIKNPYLIIHGTADDNVHFQNAADMVDAMINRNIPFDSEFYPNKNHSIYGGATRLHLYTRMTDFWNRTFSPLPPILR